MSNQENSNDKIHVIFHNLKNVIRRQKLILDEMSADLKNGKKIDNKYIHDMDQSILQINDIWKNNKEYLS